MRRQVLGLLVASASVVALGVGVPAAPVAVAASPDIRYGVTPKVPVLAYYYIWFDTGSWDRAKRDFPLVGRYSSNDPDVMRTQIRQAKRAGINGFIVSWKHTPSLDRRLATLINVAESEHFSLAMIYQGLDFYRRPLPAERVGADLEFFARTYARREPFKLFEKPLVIWSGTWEFSPEDVKRTTDPVRDRLTVLASEKNANGYERLADAVDGDAYYWSSVNPDTYPAYEVKLAQMAQTVHDRGGLWIAPAAPGFDARAIGGTTTVPRDAGRTLLRECAAAFRSKPDAIGLISWNEFSENSHIEPSVRNGSRYLSVAAKCSATGRSGGQIVASAAADSADSSSPGRGPATGLLVAPLSVAAMAIAFVAVLRRGRKKPEGRGDEPMDPDTRTRRHRRLEGARRGWSS